MPQQVLSFWLNRVHRTIDFSKNVPWTPTTTVLQYLRAHPDLTGTKEGCAEGDCGACTVVLSETDTAGNKVFRAVDSCLIFLPMIDGKELFTIESLGETTQHPIQTAMIEKHASQCGFCTPGIVMSLFALYQKDGKPDREKIDDVLTGNLCRCTGYRPIIDSAIVAFENRSKKENSAAKEVTKKSLAIITPTQSYYRPIALSEAFRLKVQHPEANMISGATDVALRVTKRHENVTPILDLSAIDEMKEIETHEDKIIIGAGVSLTTILEKLGLEFPALHEALKVFGSVQIRNLGTLGGHLGSASPIGDMLPVLMAYEAKIYLESIHGRRKVDMDVFITGYRQTVRTKDEIITAVKIPRNKNVMVRFYKVSKRKDLDISSVSGGFRLERDAQNTVTVIKLGFGGMAEMTMRAERVELFLTHKKWTRENVEAAMTLMDDTFTPISDARAGAEFRKLAARNLLLKFWNESNEQ